MKKYLQILAAVAAVMTVSCAKQAETDNAALNGNDVKAYFEASANGVKAILDGTDVSWENGDEIAVFQYGRWVKDENRNSEQNSFISDGTSKFSGTIKEYKLRDESKDVDGGKTNSVAERFYAVYPAASCSGCGINTAKYEVTVPASQTGMISDFKKNAIFLGYLNADPGKMGPVTSYDEGTQTLTFLRPFDMYCMTPILKFNVPASLGINKIEISGISDKNQPVSYAGTLKAVRSDSQCLPTLTNGSPVTISKEGNSVISGDVYAFILPNKGDLVATTGNVFQWTQYKDTSVVVKFDVSTADGKTATLKLPITGDIKAGTIKNLPAFPSTIAWDLPVGPGISDIRSNIDQIVVDGSTKLAKYTRFMVTPEDASSTIKYTSSSESTPASATIDYDAVSGIPSMDPLYTMFKVSTDGYSPRTVCALSWILNQNTGFGKDFVENHPETPAVGDTYPSGDAYSYGLKFTYKGLGTGNSNLPTIDNNYFYFAGNTTEQKKKAEGALSFKAPQTGTALVMFHHMNNTNARPFRAQNITKGTSVQINSGTTGVGVVKTETFNVSAGDIIMVDINKAAGTGIYSFTFLWEPVPATATSSIESYSGRTGYDL